MPYNARVYRVLIASPNDVIEERNIIAQVIQEWNDVFSYEKKAVLLPLRWETHSSPELGERPQQIINREVVDYCDFVVGVFWTRIGSPTGISESGTLEEIERAGAAGKLIMLYFSKLKVDLESVDLEQYQKLKAFKKKVYPNGLVESYSSLNEFKNKFSRHLEIKLRKLITEDSGFTDSLEVKKGKNAELKIELIDGNSGNLLGSDITLKNEIIECTNKHEIPDLVEEKNKSDLMNYEQENVLINIGDQISKNYYRDLVDYYILINKIHKLKFAITNSGVIGAKDIFVEIKIDDEKNSILLFSEDQKPSIPLKYHLTSTYITQYYSFEKSKFTISKENYHNKIEFDLPAIQPKRTLIIENGFFIGAQSNRVLTLQALIYADCFPEPIQSELKINFETERTKLKFEDILAQFNEKI